MILKETHVTCVVPPGRGWMAQIGPGGIGARKMVSDLNTIITRVAVCIFEATGLIGTAAPSIDTSVNVVSSYFFHYITFVLKFI